MIGLIGLALLAPAMDVPAVPAQVETCVPSDYAPCLVRIPREDGSDLIVIPASWDSPFDAVAGDQIVVRFIGSDGIEEADFQAKCDDMGGQLSWSSMWTGGEMANGEFVCGMEGGVDF